MSITDRIAGVSGDTAFKQACRVATTANITLSGLQTIDDITLVDGDRVMVWVQTDSIENGIYNASAGVWSRAKDFNGSRDVTRGTRASVVDGTLYANNVFVLTSADTVVIGTSAITFVLDATISAASAAAASASAADSDASAIASAASAVTAATISASAREAIGFSWEFDNTVTMADPTATKFRMNNATYASVTAIALADTTADTGTPDVSTFVLAWDDSASTNRGTVILREIANPENFAIFNITGASTDNTGWTELAVTYVTGNSTFTNAGDVMITFLRTGDVGSASAVIPSITVTDTGKIMVVNAAGDSFELHTSGAKGEISVSGGADATPEWVTAGAVNTSLMGGGVGVNPSFRVLVGADMPAGSEVLIEEIDVTTPISEIVFNTGLSSAYSRYRLEFENFTPVNPATYLYAQLSTDGGSTYRATAYSHNLLAYLTSSSTPLYNQNANNSVIPLSDLSDNNTWQGLCGQSHIYNMHNALETSFDIDVTSYWAVTRSHFGSGRVLASEAQNALRLYFSTGNIKLGKARLYGTVA